MTIPITIHQLLVFCTVLEKGGFTKAAEHLMISQPSISAAVNTLEKRLGTALIDRQYTRKDEIVLTDAGEKVYKTAQEIFKLLDDLNAYLSKTSYINTDDKLVTVITNAPVGSYILPDFINAFQRMNPDIRVDAFLEMNYTELTKALFNNIYDIGILPDPPKGLEVQGHFEKKLMLVASGASYDPDQTYSIADIPLILPPKNSPVRRVLDRYFAEKGIRPKVMLTLGHPETMKKTVKFGNGAAVLSEMGVQEEIAKGELIELRMREGELPIIRYAIVRPPNKPITEATRIVIEALLQLHTNR